jgi:hypothetical protein
MKEANDEPYIVFFSTQFYSSAQYGVSFVVKWNLRSGIDNFSKKY